MLVSKEKSENQTSTYRRFHSSASIAAILTEQLERNPYDYWFSYAYVRNDH